ncbi:hypothetical protein RF11_04693 [Thelohanellus kitauei]|uniref:Uncharacterized protein n=1 Tax=Thelohanellus kitauei TaxID=669202 RepID=A0A0C2N129_THEKT|nr:hypothetical protein RF11_04693 [Thelohanellus kitauei]
MTVSGYMEWLSDDLSQMSYSTVDGIKVIVAHIVTKNGDDVDDRYLPTLVGLTSASRENFYYSIVSIKFELSHGLKKTANTCTVCWRKSKFLVKPVSHILVISSYPMLLIRADFLTLGI